MNPVIETILSRRSVRKYQSRPIPQSDRDLILKCGLYAPSAKNAQAWHLLAVEDPEVIGRITKEVKEAILRAGVAHYQGLAKSPRYTVNFLNAPLFVIVSANPAATACPVEDCAVLVENMFIAAHALGIGSCWINQLGCVTNESLFREFLSEIGVPAENTVYASACFGYAEGEVAPASERKKGLVKLIPQRLTPAP